jgi:hypothetical protein
MIPRILGEEFEAALQQASEMTPAVPSPQLSAEELRACSPQLSAEELRAYKHGLRALRDEMKRGKKAAEAAEANLLSVRRSGGCDRASLPGYPPGTRAC